MGELASSPSAWQPPSPTMCQALRVPEDLGMEPWPGEIGSKPAGNVSDGRKWRDDGKASEAGLCALLTCTYRRSLS